VARNSISGDFARDWEHVFLLGKARANSRPGSGPPLSEALIGWKLVMGYPVRIHGVPDGKGRPLDHRPSWRVPPLWEAPLDGPGNRFPDRIAAGTAGTFATTDP
jgi:hypothetical protein